MRKLRRWNLELTECRSVVTEEWWHRDLNNIGHFEQGPIQRQQCQFHSIFFKVYDRMMAMLVS